MPMKTIGCSKSGNSSVSSLNSDDEPEHDEREHRHDGDDRALDGKIRDEHGVSLTPD